MNVFIFFFSYLDILSSLKSIITLDDIAARPLVLIMFLKRILQQRATLQKNAIGV